MADDEQIEVDDEPIELDAPERGSATELMDHGAAGELGPMRHSAAHVLAEAVLDLFPGTKLGIGPVIEDGFYYDFLLPRPLTPDDLPKIEERMRDIDRGRPPVRVLARRPRRPRGRRWSSATSRSRSRSSTTSLAASKRDGTPMPPTTFYRQGPFIDLCRGPHVASTGKIGPFKLLGTAGAYWRGDEKRPMLQRVYGTAWATQEELDAYLWRREEAKKRDHRRLGVAARPVLVPRRVARVRRSGIRRASASGARSRAPCASCRRGAATRRSRRRSSCRSSSGASPATGTCTATTCSWSSPRTRRSASSR